MEHEKPFERADLKQFHWEKGVFPQPSQVLEASLQRIEPDGSVTCYDEDNDSWFRFMPHEKLNLSNIPQWEYDRHKLSVARTIYGYVLEISLTPTEEIDGYIENLALYLSTYRGNPEFLKESLSLIELSDSGALLEPNLP